MVDKPLQDIGNNDEEIGGERVTLPKTITATNPVAGHPIEEDSSVTGGKDTLNPTAPPGVKPPGPENIKKTIPVNRVESLLEVKLKHNRRHFFKVATPNKVSSVDNVRWKITVTSYIWKNIYQKSGSNWRQHVLC
jgi:hypothetical protein